MQLESLRIHFEDGLYYLQRYTSEGEWVSIGSYNLLRSAQIALKYFKCDEQPEVQPKEQRSQSQMNYSTAIFLIKPEAVSAVKCAYELDEKGNAIRCYTFKTHRKDLAKGDFVVVPTHTRVGFTVVRVEELDVEIELDSTIDFKWIVAKVDRAEYDSILAAEADMIAAIKRSEVRKKRKEVSDALFKDQEDLKVELESKVIQALPAQTAEAGSKTE